jgi:tetratricopeptide (TPR) repeat protein
MSDGEAGEQVRNLIGTAFYQQEMPRLALEQHDQCLQAIRSGVVQDPSLRLSIYNNLANDYWALNEAKQAVGAYQEAQSLLAEVNNLERQAANYRELSAAQHAAGATERAAVYAERSRNISATVRNLVTAAQLSANLAALRIGQQEYGEAEPLLARAEALLQSTGNNLLRSTVYEHYATLALGRGALERATEYATQSLKLGEQAHQGLTAESDAQARTAAIRAYVRALRIAGLVEEQRGRPAKADTSFRRALALINDSVPAEIGSEIELTYAELLAARGAHEQASSHYRAAFRHRQHGSAR